MSITQKRRHFQRSARSVTSGTHSFILEYLRRALSLEALMNFLQSRTRLKRVCRSIMVHTIYPCLSPAASQLVEVRSIEVRKQSHYVMQSPEGAKRIPVLPFPLSNLTDGLAPRLMPAFPVFRLAVLATIISSGQVRRVRLRREIVIHTLPQYFTPHREHFDSAPPPSFPHILQSTVMSTLAMLTSNSACNVHGMICGQE